MTETEIKKAKPKEKDYFLNDRDGLRLRVSPAGSKTFQMRYSFGDKRKLITIGQYPSVSLEQAREKVIGYKKLILAEADPQENKKLDKAAKIKMKEGQLHLVVEAWLKFKEKQVTYSTLKKNRQMMDLHLLPHFSEYDSDRKIVSSTHIEDIAHLDITHIIAKIQDYRVELARRLFTHCINIWQFALGRGYIETNCLFKIDTKQLLLPKVTNHYEKITDEATLGELLRAIDGYIHSPIIRSALKFVSIIPLRAENLATLKWSYIDFEKKILTIPRSEMKVKKKSFPDFSLPLPTQAIEILKEIKKNTGWGVWIFHGHNKIHKPMVSESANKALRSMGFADAKRGRKQTLHSFRGTFRSLCDTHQDKHNMPFEIKEAVLDHRVGNNVTQAYLHKADYVEQMRPLLQWWADYLDELKER
ncbi:tyrosine-type recombinase/integrase [Helicobacter labetoulli]|uniref:tyrosine-type recombinase/integrase n=1 Tax=Helicobacter labetoulli TaxID=2315333 RepID=UPI000EF74BF8|nr:integrase arm-type DNA-binding domain-containing protein [Helicobacter labetoulli]